MSSTLVVLLVASWVIIGVVTGAWMIRRGHDPLWLVVSVALGPLFVPVALERVERRPRLAASGPGGVPPVSPKAPRKPRVLVGMDGSPQSEHALTTALGLFGTGPGLVMLTEVVPYDATVGTTHERLDAATERLAAAVAGIGDSVPVHFEVLAGPPGETLRRFAKEQNMDLLVVGRRGRGMSARLLGSVSADVVRRCPVPVLVVDPAAGESATAVADEPPSSVTSAPLMGRTTFPIGAAGNESAKHPGRHPVGTGRRCTRYLLPPSRVTRTAVATDNDRHDRPYSGTMVVSDSSVEMAVGTRWLNGHGGDHNLSRASFRDGTQLPGTRRNAMPMSAKPPRRILVATDLSTHAGHAVRRAAQLCVQHDARLTALYVVPEGLDADLTEFARIRLRSHLDQYADQCTHSVATGTLLRHGSVVRQIDAEAARRDADLLVMGAHGGHWHWAASAFLGSTVNNLLRVSRRPTLVVKNPPEDTYRTVLLAADTSSEAARAARVANALTPQANHILIHVAVVLGETLMRMRGASEAQLTQLRETSTELIRGDIDSLAAELGARAVIESGRPQTRLPQLCHRHAADLVTVGTGSRTQQPGYALLGSVTQHVLRHAESDVFIVPAEKD